MEYMFVGAVMLEGVLHFQFFLFSLVPAALSAGLPYCLRFPSASTPSTDRRVNRMGAIRPQIVLFGDSLTEWSLRVGESGWGATTVDYFSRKADVVVRGYGGYNTRMALILLNKIFPIPSSNPPLLVTVFFGANDASDPRAHHRALHVPLPEYRENTQKILAHLKTQSDSTKMILIAPPPVSDKTLLRTYPDFSKASSAIPTRRNELTRLYAAECVKVAQEENLPVIDLWSIFQEDPDWEEKYLADGLHLSDQGNAKVFEELLKVLESVPALKADQMPWDFPLISQMGPNPAVTLKKFIKSNL